MNYSQALTKALEVINQRKRQALLDADIALLRSQEIDEVAKSILAVKTLTIDVAWAQYKALPHEHIKQQLQQAKALADKLCQKHNIHLQPIYTCSLCNDNGYIGSEQCQCLKTQVHKLFMPSDSNVSIAFESASQTQEIVKCLEWCNKFPNCTKPNITLSGKAGTGKTYLTRCIEKHLSDKGFLVTYKQAFDLNVELTIAHTDYSESKYNNLFKLLDCDLLIIDDLGTEPITNNVTLEYLFYIINSRREKNKATIVSTNLTHNDIKLRYGERFFSRLSCKKDTHQFELTGADRRLTDNKQ